MTSPPAAPFETTRSPVQVGARAWGLGLASGSRLGLGAGARVRARAEVRAGLSVHACIHSMHMSLLATSVLLKTTTSGSFIL